MKKYLILIAAVLVLLAFSTSSALAVDGTYGPVNSTPVWATTYYAYTWSSIVKWDLTNDPNIPANAVITGMTVDWDVNRYGYYGMHVALLDNTGSGYYIPFNGATIHDFDGRYARNLWQSAFWVEQWDYPGQALQIAPRLTISWHTP